MIMMVMLVITVPRLLIVADVRRKFVMTVNRNMVDLLVATAKCISVTIATRRKA